MRAKVLKNWLLLGEERKFGDVLEDEDLLQIDAEIIQALVNQEIIRLSDTDEDSLDELKARIEKLEVLAFAPPLEGQSSKASVGE